jgi:beta-phosphoglucomutase-like phosphatase (HAD superfamily)
MKNLGLEPGTCGVVGDTHFDVLAALDAGIGAIFLVSDEPEQFAGFPVEVFPDMEFLRDRLESLLAA